MLIRHQFIGCRLGLSDAAVRPPTVKTVKLGDTVGLTASVTIRKSELVCEPLNRQPIEAKTVGPSKILTVNCRSDINKFVSFFLLDD